MHDKLKESERHVACAQKKKAKAKKSEEPVVAATPDAAPAVADAAAEAPKPKVTPPQRLYEYELVSRPCARVLRVRSLPFMSSFVHDKLKESERHVACAQKKKAKAKKTEEPVVAAAPDAAAPAASDAAAEAPKPKVILPNVYMSTS